VVLVTAATNFCYSTTTDGFGRFAFDLLSPEITLRVRSPGMSRQTPPGLHVDVGGATELAFKLAVAGNKETLTLLQPDYGRSDLRLTRRLDAGDRVKLELIVESFNRDNRRIQITQDGLISNTTQYFETTNAIGISSFPDEQMDAIKL
jgi:hypothetical protein